jgi:glycosyltransferase involved in cell wall biosynthesis
MAAGLAVIAPSYSSEIAAVVETEGCGVLVDFEDTKDVAVSLRSLAEDPEKCAKMGKAGRDAFIARHNWEVEFGHVLSLLRVPIGIDASLR